ncbi:paraquat-inducible protein A [Variovorax rhizosphaerae]|uniref:Paraquat-inducible protein A n=1 Tax=Variovorax rhizosphaerae TaxID=1836200 RepID=A0ABU8WW26_9BURK
MKTLAEGTPVTTAASLGLMVCSHCGTVWADAHDDEHCERCGTRLHPRKPQSVSRTWAFLLAACVMYIPANMLPVMITTTLFGTQYDTILSGIIYFFVSGAYGLAAVIFIASFLVPLFKLVALLILVVGAQRQSSWRRLQRSNLYHVVEFIGRWSMLDVFVVSLMTGLVQMKGLAVVNAGVGIAAFGAVVVLTMLASLSFDPRLTWDDPQDMSDDVQPESEAHAQ